LLSAARQVHGRSSLLAKRGEFPAALERDAETPLTPARARELLGRLDDIERDVNRVKVPASFAHQFYDLRYHVNFVRKRLNATLAG
jgi:hypothetical protein